MTTEIVSDMIKALPMQLIDVDGGIVVKRSCTEFKVSGSGIKEVLNWMIEVSSGSEGVSRQELINAFSGVHRKAVSDLLSQLEARNLFVSINGGLAYDVSETKELRKENIFYWNFSKTEHSVSSSLAAKELIVLGVNYITQHLVKVLTTSGCKNIKLIDVPNLRNVDFFTENGELDFDKWSVALKPQSLDIKEIEETSIDCLIATSDFGGEHAMREWNKRCVARGIHFLPIVLQNLIGNIGPHVIPGETPCYECLRARQNSNLENIDDERAAEQSAFDIQNVVGFHPSMATMLADLAHLEISKFYGGWSNSSSIGKLIQVHMLTPSISTKSLLKVPRCSVCSPMKKTASMVVQKDFYMPGNEEL